MATSTTEVKATTQQYVPMKRQPLRCLIHKNNTKIRPVARALIPAEMPATAPALRRGAGVAGGPGDVGVGNWFDREGLMSGAKDVSTSVDVEGVES